MYIQDSFYGKRTYINVELFYRNNGLWFSLSDKFGCDKRIVTYLIRKKKGNELFA
ncbi:MAG: hypothetical protein NVSMB24_34020 [Mucilaginibacter sp.]